MLAAGGGEEGPPPPTGAVATLARFTEPSVECPDGSDNRELKFIVIFDVHAGDRPVLIDGINMAMTVVSSPDLPAELGFVSTRPTIVIPTRVDAQTTSTLRAESTLLCTNGVGGPLRYNDWQAGISITDTSGAVLRVSTTGTPFRVYLP